MNLENGMERYTDFFTGYLWEQEKIRDQIMWGEDIVEEDGKGKEQNKTQYIQDKLGADAKV